MTGTTPAGTSGPRATPATVVTRSSNRSADGRRWELVTAPTRVAAVTAGGTVAEAHVSERDDQVIVEFWADRPGLPSELSAQVVTQAFSLPAVRSPRPVLVCVPRHDGEMLAQARRHLEGARTRAAGVTCFVEGRVWEDELPPAGSAARVADHGRVELDHGPRRS